MPLETRQSLPAMSSGGRRASSRASANGHVAGRLPGMSFPPILEGAPSYSRRRRTSQRWIRATSSLRTPE
jgi:hypothetical protein